MMDWVGERMRDKFSGKTYTVKLVEKEWVLLQCEGEYSQRLTGLTSLKLSYEKLGRDSAVALPM